MGKKKRLQMQRRPPTPKRPEPSHQPVRDAQYQALVEKYRAGTPKESWVDPSGTEDEWEARLFHGWLNGRDIPVEDLCVLFNRDEATIRRWLAREV